MRLAICGHGRHGKGTAARWLADHTALRYVQSTSEAAAEVVWRAMAPRYDTPVDCFADRHNHRGEWAQIIWRHNQPDGTTLYEDMTARNDIIDGIRRKAELAAVLAAGICDVSIWVDASRRKPLEPADSMELVRENCSLCVDNNGTPDELAARLRELCDVLAIPLRREKGCAA